MTSIGSRPPSLLQKLAFWQVRRLARDGDGARDRKDWPAAIACYQAYLTLRPRRWHIRVQLGHAYKEIGDFLAAEAAYRNAAEAAPDDADAHLQLARALALGGKLDAARSAYQRSCDLDPDGPAKHELETFEQSLRGDSANRPPDWRSLSDARAARDRRAWAPAAVDYRTYLTTDSRSAEIWEELAGVLDAAEQHIEALEAVQRALVRAAPTVTALALKARILRALGRVEASTGAWMEVAHMSGAAAPTDDFGQPLSAPTPQPRSPAV